MKFGYRIGVSRAGRNPCGFDIFVRENNCRKGKPFDLQNQPPWPHSACAIHTLTPQKESLISQKFLDRYDGQTLPELIAMKDEYRVDSLILAIHQALQHVPENAMTETARMVNAIVALETEVINGGYEQFFINWSGEYTRTIVNALESIGCPKTAEITAEAIAVLQLPDDYDADLVEQRVADLSDEALDTLRECDSRYFESGEDIAAAHFAYLEKHQDEIRIPYVAK